MSAKHGGQGETSRLELLSSLFCEPDTILEGEVVFFFRSMAINDLFKRVRKSRAS